MTTDSEQAERVAAKIEAGMVFVNLVGADGAELPFGGVKNSGFGRELGRYGIDEFVNKKLIRIGQRASLRGGPLRRPPLTPVGAPRVRLVSPRRFFASTRRFWDARVGRVLVRGRRTSSAWASRSASARAPARGCGAGSGCPGRTAVTRGPSLAETARAAPR